MLLVYRFLAHQKHIWSAMFYYYYWNTFTGFLLTLLLFESEGIIIYFRPWILWWIIYLLHILFFMHAFYSLYNLRRWFQMCSRWWWWDTAFYLQYEYSLYKYNQYIKKKPFYNSYSFNKVWLHQQTYPHYLKGLNFWWLFWITTFLIFYGLVYHLDNYAYSYQWSVLGIILYGFEAPQYFTFFNYFYAFLFVYPWIIWFSNNIYIHIRTIHWPHGLIYVLRISELFDTKWMGGDIIGLYNYKFQAFFHPRAQDLYELPRIWINWHHAITDADLQYWKSSGLYRFYNFIQWLIAYGPFDDLRDSPLIAFTTDFTVFPPKPKKNVPTTNTAELNEDIF